MLTPHANRTNGPREITASTSRGAVRFMGSLPATGSCTATKSRPSLSSGFQCCGDST